MKPVTNAPKQQKAKRKSESSRESALEKSPMIATAQRSPLPRTKQPTRVELANTKKSTPLPPRTKQPTPVELANTKKSTPLPPRTKQPTRVEIANAKNKETLKKKGRLESSDVFMAIDLVEFQSTHGPSALGSKLDQSTSAQQRDDRNITNGKETMRARVEKIINEYNTRFAEGRDVTTNNAMTIAIAIQGIARILADELYDPSLEQRFAKALADGYRDDLIEKLPDNKGGEATNRTQSLKLASILVSDDPLSLYMHDELRLNDAVERIRNMAGAAGMEPSNLCLLLRQKWEAELASYTMTDVKSREHNLNLRYSIREATGEMSSAYMTRLFPDLTGEGHPPERGDKSLAFGDSASKKLEDLIGAAEPPEKQTDDKVVLPSITQRLTKRPATRQPQRTQFVDGVLLTDKQIQHLQMVEKEDKAVFAEREKQVLTYLMGEPRNLTKEQAEKVVAKIKEGLSKIPLTITVKGNDWFGGTPSEGEIPLPTSKSRWPWRRVVGVQNTEAAKLAAQGALAGFDPVFKPATSRKNTTTIGEVIGKPGQNEAKLTYLGKYIEKEPDRGEEYLKFRTWKDQRMTNNLGFADAELPTFGAMNANWEKTRGTSAPTRDVRETYKAGTGKDMPKTPDSINYYGDVHFVLKKDQVKHRVVYTATDHGRPHRDPFLVLADVLVGDTENYTASVTGVHVNPIKRRFYADQLINTALTGEAIVLDELPFEIQIFGGVDLRRRDVESIHVSGSISPLAAQRLMALKDKLPNMEITVGLGGPENRDELPTDQPTKWQAAEFEGVPEGVGQNDLHVQVDALIKRSVEV